MANPLDYLQAITKISRKRLKDGTCQIPILHSNGKQMGTLVLGKRFVVDEVLTFLGFKKFLSVFPYLGFSFNAVILDSDDKPVMKFSKQLSFTQFEVEIYDHLNRKIGTLKKVPPDSTIDETSKKSQLNLYDHTEKLIALFRGDWSAWNMQILDTNHKAIGKLHKGYTDVNKVVHGSNDFFVTQIYTGTSQPNFRILVMGVGCAIDLIENL
ncbi:MAG: hypothetical protein LWY06_05580 [Firmicutes bacterium]|nr:hypothetical protein [Bacillota bacterium]